MLNPTQKRVIFAITVGNILEWYDFYLYVFWSPILSKLFFSEESKSTQLFFVIVFFAIGFIFRPIGGIVFGRLGDRIGRRTTFILSLLLMSVLTFAMGFLPTHAQVGILAPILLAVLRIAQTLPSGGELPGAFCYLYESGPHHKKFSCSFAGVGNQIGIILAAIECYFLESWLPADLLSSIGWRISFIVGGIIGIGGIFLRYSLQETASFQEMLSHHRIVKTPILDIFRTNWKKIVRGISFGVLQTVGFHFISILFPIYFFNLIGATRSDGVLATIVLLILMTIPLPIYGWLAEKHNIASGGLIVCVSVFCLLYPLHHAIALSNPIYALSVIALIALCISYLTAMWPYFISHLFPTRTRYTCVGLSLNLSDGVIGGISSLIALYFVNIVNNFSFFVLIVFISCLISFSSLFKFKLVTDLNNH